MTTSPETPAAPLVDLQRLFVAIRRRKRLWLATALLGLIAGALVGVVLPAAPTAVTKVIVVHQDDSPTDSGTLIRTDVAVLSTTQIAAGALKRLGSTESYRTHGSYRTHTSQETAPDQGMRLGAASPSRSSQ